MWLKFQSFAFRTIKLEIIALILIATFLLLNSNPGEALWGKKTKEISGEELKKVKAELNIAEDPRFHPYSDPGLKEVLDNEIDPQKAPGLTFGVFILNAIYEEKLVEMCYPHFYDEESSRFFSLLADNLTSWQKNFAEKTTKTTLETVIKASGASGVSIGISSLFLAVDLAQIGVGIMKLAEVVRNRALSFYMIARGQGDSHEVAWSVAGIPPLYDNWQTQEFFKSLWNKYAKHMSEDGLDKDFAQQEREKLRTSFLDALGAKAHPTLTSPLKITPSAPYYLGDKINAEFTITNEGVVPISFNVLTVGGRDPDDQVADFTFRRNRRNITLAPNQSYNYKGTLTLTKAGKYHFFCTYQTPEGDWNTSVDLGFGLSHEDRIKNIIVKANDQTKPDLTIENTTLASRLHRVKVYEIKEVPVKRGLIFLLKDKEGVRVIGPEISSSPQREFEVESIFYLADQEISKYEGEEDGYIVRVNSYLTYDIAIDDFEDEVDLARVELSKEINSIKSNFIFLARTGGIVRVKITAIVNEKGVASSGPIGIEVRLTRDSGVTMQQLTPTTETLNLGLPSKVVIDFYTLWRAKKNYDEAKKLLTPEALKGLETEGGLKQTAGDYYRKFQKPPEIFIVKEKIEGTRASVTFISCFNGEIVRSCGFLRKINNEWKIAFE